MRVRKFAITCLCCNCVSLYCFALSSHAAQQSHTVLSTNATIKHREEVLAANREANKQLRASLEHARQVAQQSADMEATKLAEVANATAKEVRRATALAFAGAGYSPLNPSASPGTTVSLAAALIAAAGASMVAPPGGLCRTPLVQQPQAPGPNNTSP